MSDEKKNTTGTQQPGGGAGTGQGRGMGRGGQCRRTPGQNDSPISDVNNGGPDGVCRRQGGKGRGQGRGLGRNK